MKIVAHASPSILEAELLDRVAAVKSRDPLASVLIVVPSRRLADHVAGRLVERFGSILGVSALHHRALAERIVASAGGACPRRLDDDLEDALWTRVLDRAAPGPLRDFAREHPGAASALRKTLTDLREAGIEPAAATATLSGAEAETASLYARWAAALDELATGGRAIDDAGLARAAASGAQAFGARFAAIFHHGAYDLIGVRVDLVRALDRGCEMTFLLPADPAEQAGAFGVARARAIAPSDAAIVALDRASAPASIDALHAQGAHAELQTAVYDALAAVASGAPPHEVAIVVRSFGAYAAALDALLDGAGPSWNTSYVRPLRRDPLAGQALRVLAAAPDHGPGTFTGHADAFAATAAESGAALSELLDSMRALETTLGDERRVSRREALAWLDARADAATRPPPGADGGGVRILDAMQSRGLTFSHVGLLGMNTGLFPSVSREDPFLSDASRAALREATHRPLPVAAERDGEERLLLAMLLGQTRERLRVSWRRADDAARPMVPSLALREIARFAGRRPDASAIVDDARALPAHPRARLEAWSRAPGLLDARDETLLAALASETGADAALALASRRPDWTHGITLLAATESFAPTPGRYDGRIGRPALPHRPSVSALETLGRCPLQYFFQHVLRVEAPRTPPTPFEPDAAATGTRVHETLRLVYERLLADRAFGAEGILERVAMARRVLPEAWASTAGEDEARRAAQWPVLARIEDARWLDRLSAFLDDDLRRLDTQGLVPEALEHRVSGALPGSPEGPVLHARLDRVLGGAGGCVVSDYKTGRNLEGKAQPAAMLQGEALQVPIYELLSGAPVELLGVGLVRDPDAEVVRFEGWKSEEQRAGFLETLRVLFALAEAGRFPIHPDDHCDRCDYRSACRRGHPPTVFREEHAPDVADARDCWSKSAKTPSLAAVRAGRAS